MPDAAVPIERLLAHRAWVRAVARALSRGAEAGADDLEQETWLAALVLAAIAAAWWSVGETTTPGGARTIATATESASPPTPPPAAAHPRVRAAADAATSPATAPAAPTRPATRIVRWRVVAGEAPTPASGSVLAVERDRGAIGLPPGLTTVRVDGDDLVAEGIGAGTIQGFAVAPDGSRAKLFALNADERGADTKFLKERRIVVTIVEADASPAVGVPLQLRNQGNIAIRSDVRTDAAGRAEFAGLSPMEGRLDVHMGVGEHAFLSRWLGTYRLRDEATGATSAETDLTEDGAESPVVVLDLSRAGPIRGRVEVDGGEMRDARVIVEGVPDFVHTGDPKRRTVLPAADGSFETWVPGDRPLHLHAEHPLLRPGGAADVTGPTDGVVLRLVPGPTISFRVPGVALKEAYRAMTVRFFRGEPSGEAAFTKSNVVSEDDRYRVGGIDAGTWTVWIDVPERAPKILRGVVLGDESIDLGDVVPDAGPSLHVKVATFPNEVPARVGVSVSGRDGMKLLRFTSSHGESDVVVKGLVPGTYDVFVYPQSGSFPSDRTDAADPPFLHRTVVVDASNETTIDYSPR